MARRGPRWYFSFRSPYSWMAYRDLTGSHPDVAERIEWLPFWEPDESAQDHLERNDIALPYVAMSKEKHLYILQDVRRLARARGLEMVWPVDPAPRWEVSHLAYLAADELGAGREFIDETYRARWELGEDISEPETMGRIGKTLGLDPLVLAGAHQDPQIRERGLAALGSLHRDGVFGVPFFISGFDKFWGVDRLPDFVGTVRAHFDRHTVKED
ncbi:2-hydroxychromene-2-carboxylate isomerase [Streptomyces xantholiticus]|uniref:2-hydroxychromene-2-carboxylate isomerase n=1 Tax=Streptomyces xantholiticus TaxID=68285 RepID=UPI001676BA41|nr:DsbA family protein [Streptomyces xantholiticus]GGW69191.1 2-hydroxychromene-2-carboxylate isomerase [Streptomyces xantholiticus]